MKYGKFFYTGLVFLFFVFLASCIFPQFVFAFQKKDHDMQFSFGERGKILNWRSEEMLFTVKMRLWRIHFGDLEALDSHLLWMSKTDIFQGKIFKLRLWADKDKRWMYRDFCRLDNQLCEQTFSGGVDFNYPILDKIKKNFALIATVFIYKPGVVIWIKKGATKQEAKELEKEIREIAENQKK